MRSNGLQTETKATKETKMNIQEFTCTDSPEVADGTIKNVLICGFKSKNRRVYAKEALEKAIPLYQGTHVYTNHTQKKGPRTAEERFGTLNGVHLAEDGLRGDLSFLTTHPLSERVVEDLSRDLKMFGLSHCVEGDVKKVGDTMVVEAISSVDSVDLVTNPATVQSLREETEVAPAPDPEPEVPPVAPETEVAPDPILERLEAVEKLLGKLLIKEEVKESVDTKKFNYLKPRSGAPITEQILPIGHDQIREWYRKL